MVSRALDKPTEEELRKKERDRIALQKMRELYGDDVAGQYGDLQDAGPTGVQVEKSKTTNGSKVTTGGETNPVSTSDVAIENKDASKNTNPEFDENGQPKKLNIGKKSFRQVLALDHAIIRTCDSIKQFRIKREKMYEQDYGWESTFLPDKLISAMNIFDKEWRTTIDDAGHPLFRIFIVVCWNLSFAVEDYATLFFFATRCISLGFFPIWQIAVGLAVASGYPKTKIKATGYIALADAATKGGEAATSGISVEDELLEFLVGVVLVSCATVFVHGTHIKLLYVEFSNWWNRRKIERERLQREKLELEVENVADECLGPVEKHNSGHMMI